MFSKFCIQPYKITVPILMMGLLISTAAIAAPKNNRDDRGGVRTRSSSAPLIKSGSPTNVFTKKAESCLDPLTTSIQDALVQDLTLTKTSTLLVSFTGEFQGLEDTNAGHLQFRLDTTNEVGAGTWDVSGNANGNAETSTVMWFIPNVPAGAHTIAAQALVHGGDGNDNLNDCSLTVFVLPKP